MLLWKLVIVFVGFHINQSLNDGRYLEGALLYDTELIRAKACGWPVPPPTSLSNTPIVWRGLDYSGRWSGSGYVSRNTSVKTGAGWNGWKSYAKKNVLLAKDSEERLEATMDLEPELVPSSDFKNMEEQEQEFRQCFENELRVTGDRETDTNMNTGKKSNKSSEDRKGKINSSPNEADIVVHPGICGIYENHHYDSVPGGKNDWHYVTIRKMDDRRWVWTNRAGVSWNLFPTAYPNKWKVSRNCPYYKTGHRLALISIKENGTEGIFGPHGELYSFEGKGIGNVDEIFIPPNPFKHHPQH